MKKIINNKYILIALTLIIGAAIGWFIKPSSQLEKSPVHAHEAETPQVWTCSMHPQIRQNEPGKCPICGMDLIPVEEGSKVGVDPDAITMSPTAMVIAGISTSVVGESETKKKVRLSGKVVENETMVYSQSSHIPGRVENLNINFSGELVKRGQVIASIYSPELVTAQKELLVAQKIKDTKPQLFNAAKEKLRSWKLSERQIQDILDANQPIERFPVTADVGGYVVKKNVNLGDYIKRGQPLYEVSDLSKVWVVFDLYESDLTWVNEDDQVNFTIESIPGQDFSGTISYIDPTIDPKTRVAKARVNVDNKDKLLKPEMFATGIVEASLRSSDKALTVPKSAVMWTGERSVVYVKNQTDQQTSFKIREVTLGAALGEAYVIKEGLEPGEEIATSGTFSIDAAAQLAGKPSMMSPSGNKPMTGHQHGEVKATEPDVSEKTFNVNNKFVDQLTKVYEKYLPVKNALVASDARNTKKHAEALVEALDKVDMQLLKGEAHNTWMGYVKPMNIAAKRIANSAELDVQRNDLITLSNSLFNSIKTFGLKDTTAYYQYCPMADNNKGAYWISAEDDIRNPYFGDAMLTCGEVAETIKSK